MTSQTKASSQFVRSTMMAVIALASLVGLVAQQLTAQDLLASTQVNPSQVQHSASLERNASISGPKHATRGLTLGLVLRIVCFAGLGIAAWDLGRMTFAKETEDSKQSRFVPTRSTPVRHPASNRQRLTRSRSKADQTQRADVSIQCSAMNRRQSAPKSPRIPLHGGEARPQGRVDQSSLPDRSLQTEVGKPRSVSSVDSKSRPNSSGSSLSSLALDRKNATTPSGSPHQRPVAAPSRRPTQPGISDVFQKILEDNNAVLHAIEQGLVS